LPDAFNLLTRLDPDRYRDIFVLYTGYHVAYVRVKAAQAIGQCKKADHFKLLRPLLIDRDHSVCVAAYRILRETTEGAPEGGIVPYLAEALQVGDKRARRTAADLLGERIAPGDVPAAINVLATVLGGKDKEDRAYVAKALTRAADDAARRRIAQAQGYVTDWMLIGPFPRDNRNQGMGPAYFPEHEIDFEKTYPPFATDPEASFRVADAACGGQTKKSLCIQPPPGGRAPAKVVASFRLALPDLATLKLAMSLGIQGTSKETDGVQFEVHVDGTKIFEHKVTAPDAWEPAEVDLAPYKGKRVVLDLVVDPLANAKDDRAVVGEPRLVAGGETITSLTESVESVPVRVVVPGVKGQMAWQAYKVNRITGEVPLYDIFPPPIYDKVAYGVADVAVAEEQKARLWIKSDDGFVLWLNGAEVKERTSTGEEKFAVSLRRGVNRFVIKVTNQRDWWRYELRLSDADDRALAFRQ